MSIAASWLVTMPADRISIRHYLSDRFRLRYEDPGIDDVMNESRPETGREDAVGASTESNDRGPGNGLDARASSTQEDAQTTGQDLDPDEAQKRADEGMDGDEFAANAIDYQVLLGKIDGLLERLNLDA